MPVPRAMAEDGFLTGEWRPGLAPAEKPCAYTRRRASRRTASGYRVYTADAPSVLAFVRQLATPQ